VKALIPDLPTFHGIREIPIVKKCLKQSRVSFHWYLVGNLNVDELGEQFESGNDEQNVAS